MLSPASRIYLDANATTPLLPEVFAAMQPWYCEHFGNPSSVHQQGQRARGAVEQARAAVGRLLKASAQEIVFTSGGTESDNLALFGTVSQGEHLITTAIEHHAVLHAAEALARQGVEVTFLPCDANGIVQPASLAAALKPNTRLVSVMLANNETGTLQPIAELAGMAKTYGSLFHTDAVQGAGKLPIDLSLSCAINSPSGALKDVDLLSISGHKMYAPLGVGVLYVRKGVKLNPMFHGGMHERQRRAGTENVPGIVALGKAAEAASGWMNDGGIEELAALRNHLEQSVLAAVPECGVNGGAVARTANTTNLYFDHVEAESLVITLDLNGLSVSGGSACQSGAAEPSHVLTAMGLKPERARSSIRVSLSRHTTRAEIDQAIQIITTSVAQLRSISKSWVATRAAAVVA